MADDDTLNEDQWLYGDHDGIPRMEPEPDPKESAEPTLPEPPAENLNKDAKSSEDAENPPEETEQPLANDEESSTKPPGEELEEGEDDEDSDDSDDNVQVTIGDIKTAAQYGNLNVKRNVMLSSGIEKHKQTGKFSIDDFESIGTINGVAAHEYSIDALEDKPWRKPGADITDYFNYGFNEETWRAYCERQKSMRIHESGAGLTGLGMVRPTTNVSLTEGKYTQPSGPPPPANGVPSGTAATAAAAALARNKAGPPGPRRLGIIDVIGSSTVASRRTAESPPKDGQIQSINVMTADKRDYGRKMSFDLSVPPPPFESGPIAPVVSYTPYSGNDFYPSEMDPYYQHYDRPPPSLWSSQNRKGRRRRQTPPKSPVPLFPRLSSLDNNKDKSSKESSIPLPEGVTIKQEPPDKPLKERERERERDRHKDRHRHRSRSRSTERRSRKHKSRSRSPSHRSHKKKKSKKSDRERSRTREREQSSD